MVECNLGRGDEGFDVVVSDVDVSGTVEGAGVVGGELDSWEVVGEQGWRENLDVGWEDGTKYIIDIHDLLSAVR